MSKSQFIIKKIIFDMALGGKERIFGIKFLNRVYIRNFILCYALKVSHINIYSQSFLNFYSVHFGISIYVRIFFSIIIKKLTKFRFTKVNSAVIIKVLKKMYILVCVLCLIDFSVLLIKN